MNRPNITPGPWAPSFSGLSGIRAAQTNELIATIELRNHTQNEATARAVSAVPDLLDALEGVLPEWHAEDDASIAGGKIAGEITYTDLRKIKSALTKVGYTF